MITLVTHTVRDHGHLHYGDIVRLDAVIRGSKGRRYTFLGAVLDASETPLHYELAEVTGRGMRAIRPEFCHKDTKASKLAQHTRAEREAEKVEASERAKRAAFTRAANKENK